MYANIAILQAFTACVDVVPLFLETAYDQQIDDEDLVVSSPPKEESGSELSICIQHKPTGIRVQSSGVYLFIFFLFVCIAYPQVFINFPPIMII